MDCNERKPVGTLLGNLSLIFNSYYLFPIKLEKALSSGGGAGEESHPRRHYLHPDLWRLPRIQSPLPCPSNGWIRFPGDEKAGTDFPPQSLQDAPVQRENYKGIPKELGLVDPGDL